MAEIQIDVIPRVRLRFFRGTIGRRWRKLYWGAWAIYVPAERLKLLHSVGGQVHCIYYKSPKREAILAGYLNKPSKTPVEVWRAALTKPVTRRVAENYVCLQRLYAAGLGPQPQGLVVRSESLS